ncbi:hypothetical protein [Sphingomonas sp.]|uniref:hypothetical protein n=1 Tax=Sphingomonas sp. TaxID=28214 RepID=UPI003D6D5D53
MPRLFRFVADVAGMMDNGRMTYALDILKAAHRHSSRHRGELECSAICGCFYCRKTYIVAEIDDWLDEGDGTAFCPHCGIDSVIGSASGYPVAEQPFLHAMHAYWFA